MSIEIGEVFIDYDLLADLAGAYREKVFDSMGSVDENEERHVSELKRRMAALDEKTGISESTISQYRSGYAKPKEKKLAIIANALNVNPAWLMGLDVPMEQPLSTENPNVDNQRIAEALSMYETYEIASPEIKVAIDTLLKTVKPLSETIQNNIIPAVENLQKQVKPAVENIQKSVSQMDIPHVKVQKSVSELPHLRKNSEE